MLTNTEIDAIRKRAEEATEGPWWASEGLYVVNNLTGDSYEWDADFVAETERESDADFIAHAREDIPKLLAEIERISSVYKRLSEYYTHANGLLEDVHELLYDSIYNDHPTFGEVSEYLNVGGDE